MRIGVLILYYNVDRFIRHTLDNCGPFADKIYLSYCAKPWFGREHFRNKSHPDSVRDHRHFSKCVVIEGDWATEEEQRNAALARSRADGMDWLIVQDADEFYREEDYRVNLEFLAQQSHAPFVRALWFTFWKSTRHMIEWDSGSHLSLCENFAVNCRQDVWFHRNRRMNSAANHTVYPVVPRPCFHLSYVLSDDEVIEKLTTWGHANDVRGKQRWFKRKWRRWTEATRFLAPTHPRAAWWRAVPFQGALPETLHDFVNPETVSVPPSTLQDCRGALEAGLEFLHYCFWRAEVKMRKAAKRLLRARTTSQ